MRRIKLILAVVAIMAISVVGSAPAMASHDNDGWWDSCGWSWSWWWGWYVVCDYDDSWWGHGGDGDDDDVVYDDDDDGGGHGDGDDSVVY